jgi:hypothetical protein
MRPHPLFAAFIGAAKARMAARRPAIEHDANGASAPPAKTPAAATVEA